MTWDARFWSSKSFVTKILNGKVFYLHSCLKCSSSPRPECGEGEISKVKRLVWQHEATNMKSHDTPVHVPYDNSGLSFCHKIENTSEHKRALTFYCFESGVSGCFIVKLLGSQKKPSISQRGAWNSWAVLFLFNVVDVCTALASSTTCKYACQNKIYKIDTIWRSKIWLRQTR